MPACPGRPRRTRPRRRIPAVALRPGAGVLGVLGVVVVAGLLAGVLTACAPGGGTGKVIGGPARPDEPSRIRIPSLGVDSPLIRLRAQRDDTVGVPPTEKAMTAGWYTGSARPGTPGTAVVVGHGPSHDGRGVFHDLDRVHEGTVIDIERGDGVVLHFTVTGTERTAHGALSARRPAATAQRQLQLVTCAGERAAGHGPAESLVVKAALND
ncbi:hypothetical protein GCM10010218_14820 [Streptomyces mashuensis]|uniref:Class F sortase n=1 Tax=Streptomyces mashuensis TaxID=33904 RepID=A0A919EC95_9ACTN|nr:class F sortase [Streptomyces mashuensis]GHF34684.1 hypothetical protein GCM10010218_14820 [Streptomyces mashuensis]